MSQKAAQVLVTGVVALALACGDGTREEEAAAPAAARDTAAAETTRMTVGPVCEPMTQNAELLDLAATWEGDQVHVEGTVVGGSGNALSLGLSQGGRFVYDRVFKADLMGVIQLDRDVIELTTATNEPSASERAAFSRTGAVPLDPSQPVCLDVLLYERGSLDRLAERHLLVEGTPPAE